MRLKYYLRGLGIGIIATTFLLMIAFSQYKPTMSDEEIMVRATDLGMVMSHNNTSVEETSSTVVNDTEYDAEASEVSNKTVIEPDTAGTAYYRLYIERGEVARDVCTHLEEAGVVDDGESLRVYLSQLGCANELSIGYYDIPYGLTMEEVADVLKGGPS
jgi:hypothetical protein